MITESVSAAIAAQPLHCDALEARRQQHTRLRRRMLGGVWKEDLETHLQKLVGSIRREAWGNVSLAINPFRNIARELAVLYDHPPEVAHDDEGAQVAMREILRLSGLWSFMAQIQAQVIGCREYLVRVDVSERLRTRYRAVAPDMVVARAMEDAPDIPVAIEELRLRKHPESGRLIWTLDVLDVSDEDSPVYGVWEVRAGWKRGEDMSAAFLGGSMSGDAYPYRRSNGRPVLPYVLFHAQRTGTSLWDPYDGIELVQGTLDVAGMYAMLVHCFLDSSWPQRYAIGATPAGAALVDTPDARRTEVITDPATLLLLEPMQDFEGQPTVGQWRPGADVATLEGTLANMVARLAQDGGVPPSDVQRLGGTARSGVAISLTNEGKRKAQRRFAQQFVGPDQRLVGLTATLRNRRLEEVGASKGSPITPEIASAGRLPEGGWRVVYRQTPLSPDELKARRENVLELRAAGLMSDVRAYRELNPGATDSMARAALAEIAADASTEPTEPSTPAPE